MKKYAGVCVQDVGLFLTIGFDGKNYFLVAGSKLAPDEVESLRAGRRTRARHPSTERPSGPHS